MTTDDASTASSQAYCRRLGCSRPSDFSSSRGLRGAISITWGAHSGWRHADAPPFSLLQGLVSSNALLITIAVLIRQNRMAQIAEHRSHLDLQINLMTEQKVTKVLELVDNAVREIKNIRGAPAEAPRQQMEEMTKPADPHAILDAIKQKQS